MDIENLVEPTAMSMQNPKLQSMRKVKKIKKDKRPSSGLQEHFGRCNVVVELARTPTGLTFGQLVHGDIEEARKVLKRLLSKNSPKVRPFVLSGAVRLTWRLKIVLLKIYGTKRHGRSNTGAVPNLNSENECSHLALMATEVTGMVTVADGTVTNVLYCVKGFTVFFETTRISLVILVVCNPTGKVRVGSPALVALQVSLDPSRAKASLVLDAEEMVLPFHREPSLVDGCLATNSDEFTSLGESEEGQFKDGPESSAPSSADESDGASELVLAIMNNEPHGPDPEGLDGDTVTFEGDEKSDRFALLALKM